MNFLKNRKWLNYCAQDYCVIITVVTTATQFNRDDILKLIHLAQQLKKYVEGRDPTTGQPNPPLTLLQGRIMTTLFYEDSSRTLSSFTCAMMRLGGQVLSFSTSSSSVNKGETLQDTVRCLDQYSDAIVLRHPQNSALEEALEVIQHPLMNAGNGSGEHPSQALLDTYTIFEELGGIDDKVVAFIGDLKMGRTVHSLSKLLARNFKLKRLYFIAPDALQMPQEVVEAVQTAAPGIDIRMASGLRPEIVADCDVLYTTRLQKERFFSSNSQDDAALKSFETAKKEMQINKERLRDAKAKMVVMHPLPRVDELSTDVDDDPRAAYFRQMRYGLFMRMAILYSVLG
eukprot:gene7018-4977_t